MKVSTSIFHFTFSLCLFAQINSFCFAQEDNTLQVSAVVGAAIGLYDIVTAPLSAKRHNDQLSTFGLKFSRDALVSHSNRSATYSPRQSVRGRKSPALALLISLAQRPFDVFITVDKKLTHQQNLQDIGFAIIVLAAKRNTFDSLKPLFAEVENALHSIKSGEVLLIKPIE